MKRLMIVQNLDDSTTKYTDIEFVPGHLEQLAQELLKMYRHGISFDPSIG